MTRSRNRRPLAVSVLFLAAVALVAVGVIVALIVLPQPRSASTAEPTGDSAVAVTSETYDGARDVGVRPHLTEAETLSVTTTGRVTTSACEPGGTLSSGGTALVVDNGPVVALATDVPLWRDLRRGHRGDDVEALQGELARLGYDVEPDGVYGYGTSLAVKDLLADVGVDRPDGSLAVDAVLWLPQPEVLIGACDVTVGDTLAGGQVATVAGGLTSLTVVEPPGEGWALRYGDRSAPIDGEGRVTDPELLAAVEAGPLLAVQDEQGGTDQLTMQIALAEPLDVVVVPPAAVVPAGAGGGCVVADGESRPVEIVSSSLGQTLVRFIDDGGIPARVDTRPDGTVGC